MSRRTLEQNALMWSCLTDLANQVEWPVDGRRQRITPADWKDILTAGLKKEQRIAAGIDGGFVILGCRTSRMTIGEMQALIDFADYVGAQNAVRWTIDTTASIASVPE